MPTTPLSIIYPPLDDTLQRPTTFIESDGPEPEGDEKILIRTLKKGLLFVCFYFIILMNDLDSLTRLDELERRMIYRYRRWCMMHYPNYFSKVLLAVDWANTIEVKITKLRITRLFML